MPWPNGREGHRLITLRLFRQTRKMLNRAAKLQAEEEVAKVPEMLNISGPAPSKALQISLIIGIGLMTVTAGYGMVTWILADDDSTDEDGDGMPDQWELQYSGEPKIEAPDGRIKNLDGLDYTKIDTNQDYDNDGLTNLQEFCWPLTVETCSISAAMAENRGGVSADTRLDPQNADSDGDGIPDGIEITLCIREMANNSRGEDGLCLHYSPMIPLDPDLDSDGFDNNRDGFLDTDEQWNSSEEVQYSQPVGWMTEFDGLWLNGSDPLNADSDGDGIPDGVEVDWQLNPTSIADGLADLDSDGWDGLLSNAEEWRINSESSNGGLLAIETDAQYASAQTATILSEENPHLIEVYSSSVWVAFSDTLQHFNSANNSSAYNFSGISSLLTHQGIQSGWLAVAHSSGVSICELNSSGYCVSDFSLHTNVSASHLTSLPAAVGTSKLVVLDQNDDLSVLEMDDSGDLITSWNASQNIQNLFTGTDVTSIEFSPVSGESGSFWAAVDSGLLEIRSNDLLDSEPLLEWHLGPYNDPTQQVPITSLEADPDNEGWVMGARGGDLIRFTGEGGIHQSLKLNEGDYGNITSLQRIEYGIWAWSTEQGIWKIDFNKHIDDRISSAPIILSEVTTIGLRNNELLISVIPGNYSGLMPMDPRSNDSDADGWLDGFELAMQTDPTRPGETFACNGYTQLCPRSYDDVVYPASHNSHANRESGFNFLAENQISSITTQLEMGVRYINMDLYEYDEEVWVCHGEWDLPLHPCLQSGGERAYNQFSELATFLANNPGEVVSLAFENYVNATVVAAEFDTAGLSQYLFSKDEQWPTLGEMVISNKRLVVLADEENQGFTWWHDEHDETRMTGYQFTSEEEFHCNNDRGNESATMLQIAHYITDPLASESDAQLVNQFASLWRHAQKCVDQHGMLPNFILVDYVDHGDAVLIAAVLNGVEDAPPGAFS